MRGYVSKSVCLAFVAGMLLAGLAAAAPRKKAPAVPAIVEAQQFILRDAAGRQLAALHGTDGIPQLALYDRDGTPKVVLSVLDNGSAAVVVGNPRGKTKAILALLPNGSIDLNLQGASGTATLAVPADQGPNLEMTDRDGKALFQAVR